MMAPAAAKDTEGLRRIFERGILKAQQAGERDET
jgi:hypothetical protein